MVRWHKDLKSVACRSGANEKKRQGPTTAWQARFCADIYIIFETVLTLIRVNKIQGWEFPHQFSDRIAGFLQKNKQIAHSLKKASDLTICSFLVSNLSDLLTSLVKKEEMSKSLVFYKTYKKRTKKYDFSQIVLSESLIFCKWKSEWAIHLK